jgi:NodT family efflux transporter outer membrane factor (OMF) lipoprotein
MQYHSVSRFRGLTVGIALTATACATVPPMDKPPAPVSATTLKSAESFGAPSGQWPADDWWTSFRSPTLNTLITEALERAPDVATAAARVRAADALAQQAGAALGPTAGLTAQAGGNKQSENTGIPPAFVPKGIQDTGSISAQAKFDLDLWGRNRAALAAAKGEAAAARVDAAQAKLMLTTGIAAALADLARYQTARGVAAEALALREQTAKLTAERVAVGVDNGGAKASADARVPQARAQISAFDEAIALTQNRMAALVGAGPDRGRSIGRIDLAPLSDGIPPNAGIALIGRRPDIVAARLRVEAAADRIKVARADFYPNVSLSLLAGFQSLGLDTLLSAGSTTGNGGIAVALPIFKSDQLQGRYRGARADFDQAVARYDATVISALRDVADVIASRRSVTAQRSDLAASLAAAREARRIAALRYRGGLASQFPVLQADDALIDIRRTQAENDARQLALDVALMRALGGGFVTPPAAPTPSDTKGAR